MGNSETSNDTEADRSLLGTISKNWSNAFKLTGKVLKGGFGGMFNGVWGATASNDSEDEHIQVETENPSEKTKDSTETKTFDQCKKALDEKLKGSTRDILYPLSEDMSMGEGAELFRRVSLKIAMRKSSLDSKTGRYRDLHRGCISIYKMIGANSKKRKTISNAKSFMQNIQNVISHTTGMKDISYTSILLLFYLKKHNWPLSSNFSNYEAEFHKRMPSACGESLDLSASLVQCFVSEGMRTNFYVNLAARIDPSFKEMYTNMHEGFSHLALQADRSCNSTKRAIVFFYAVLKEIRNNIEELLSTLLDGVDLTEEEKNELEKVLPEQSDEHIKEAAQYIRSIRSLKNHVLEEEQARKAKVSEPINLEKKKEASAAKKVDAVLKEPMNSDTITAKKNRKVPAQYEDSMSLISDLKNSAMYRKQKAIYIEANDFSESPLEPNSVLVHEPAMNHSVMAHIQTQHAHAFDLYKYAHLHHNKTK
ncbi:hypothetical protein NERG_02128 [Nematocida ausubeli]|uniref:Uncharacterized protein n=1 Tax=Nematocida ausubeli (strain ATCC PRA-371 / ERTm2) TaxID=1913371 RepID=H8ZEV9_NEMA1|nr:hypothetical protein NERG_02128 [Nematocida ausubeli]